MEETKDKPENDEQQISAETTIGDAIKRSPKVAEILFAEGLHCVGCCGAQFESIRDGLAMHGKSEEEIAAVIKKLNGAVQEDK